MPDEQSSVATATVPGHGAGTQHADGTPVRVEVVPTEQHWESVYVARSDLLARGWDRQLDIGVRCYDALPVAARLLYDHLLRHQ